MMTEQNETGGIRARRIEADNIVSGAQIQGNVDATQAAALVQLAQAIGRGEISADEIKARNLVSGLHYITDPTQASVDDLRRELAALRAKLEQAVAARDFADPTEAEDAQASLQSAEDELAKPQPHTNRVLRKLDEFNQIVTRSAAIADAAGNIGSKLIQLAPIAATVWQVAQKMLGG